MSEFRAPASKSAAGRTKREPAAEILSEAKDLFLAVPTNLRLALALFAYAVLAVLVWRTMEPDKIRLVTFAVLGLFAFRTIVQAARLKREAEGDKQTRGEGRS